MASFEEHCRDCERLLGNRFENVNHWLDEKFRQFGPLHRFARHHWRGVDECGHMWGEGARKAAIIHILKDCGWVPSARDWEERKVDALGFKVSRPFGIGDTAELVSVFNGFWDPHDFVKAAQELIDAD